MSNHFHILKMGGTIEFHDPAYEEINNKLMKIDTSIDSYLKNIIKPHFTFSTEEITAKDSRDINQHDRERLVSAIVKTEHTNVVIAHGTFTMRETAEFIDTKEINDKKIILTGSMIPLAGFNISDAGFNLGFVMASFEHLQPGVYMSMNGGVFGVSEVSKNTEIFRFE